MKNLDIKELKNIQSEYGNLIQSYSSIFETDNLSTFTVISFIEEVEIFWLKRLESAQYLLEVISNNNDCYVLSGAMYLGLENNEHYFLKAAGDYQLMYDPFMKMERFIRANIKYMGSGDTIEFFMRVYKDTYKVITEFKDQFIILPISQLAWQDESDQHNIFNDVHLNFLSGVLGKDINSNQHFSELYDDYKKISEDLDDFYLKNLIFNGIEDTELTLGDRVNNYLDRNLPFVKDKNESEKFFLATYTMIAHISDILLTAISLNLTPYIRYGVTFNYFLMMYQVFNEDKETQLILKKSILAHLFCRTYPNSFFNDYRYDEYHTQLEGFNLFQDVLDNLDIKEKNLRDLKISEVVEGIEKIFHQNIISGLR